MRARDGIDADGDDGVDAKCCVEPVSCAAQQLPRPLCSVATAGAAVVGADDLRAIDAISSNADDCSCLMHRCADPSTMCPYLKMWCKKPYCCRPHHRQIQWKKCMNEDCNGPIDLKGRTSDDGFAENPKEKETLFHVQTKLVNWRADSRVFGSTDCDAIHWLANNGPLGWHAIEIVVDALARLCRDACVCVLFFVDYCK